MASRSGRVRVACVLAMLFMPAPSLINGDEHGTRRTERAAPVVTKTPLGTDQPHPEFRNQSSKPVRLSAIHSR